MEKNLAIFEPKFPIFIFHITISILLQKNLYFFHLFYLGKWVANFDYQISVRTITNQILKMRWSLIISAILLQITTISISVSFVLNFMKTVYFDVKNYN